MHPVFSVVLPNCGALYGGKVVEGVLNLNLDKQCEIRGLYLTLVCETVTRRVKTRGGKNRQKYIKTDRDFPCRDMLKIVDFPVGEQFTAGTHSFPFNFPIREDLGASIYGPMCDYMWCERSKYEINYWFEPMLETPRRKYSGDNLPVQLFENPNLNHFDAVFQKSASHRFRKEFKGFFGSDKGSLHATVIVDRLHALIGGELEMVVGYRNDSEKQFTGFRIELDQHLDYNVTSYPKNKLETVAHQKNNCDIRPRGEEQTVTVRLRIPDTLPASTPGIYHRKIGIAYTIRVDIVKESGSSIQMFQHGIALSSLPWQA